jgi:hypothetical protein
MNKKVWLVFLGLLILALTAACSGETSVDAPAVPEITGPALVLFYTDN